MVAGGRPRSGCGGGGIQPAGWGCREGSMILARGPDNPNGEKTNTMILYPGAKAWVYGQNMPGRVGMSLSSFEKIQFLTLGRSGKVPG